MVPAAEKPAKLTQHHVDAAPAGSVVVIASPAGAQAASGGHGTSTTRARAPAYVGVPYAPSSHCTAALSSSSATAKGAVWGGLMTARAHALGVVGMVTDGRVRDLEEQRSQGFPVRAVGR